MIALILLITTCIIVNYRGFQEREVNRELFIAQMMMVSQVTFARDFNFDNHLIRYRLGSWQEIVNDQMITTIIFVHSEDAAIKYGLPLDTMIAWPSIYTLAMLESMNAMEYYLEMLEYYKYFMASLGLSFPITVDNLIYNWDEVSRFYWEILSSDMHTTIRSHASAYEHELETNRIMRRLLFPGRLDAINELIISRDPSYINLDWINQVNNTNHTVSTMPLPPFTEDEARNNPRLIELIIYEFLTFDEWLSVEPESILRRLLEK